jgi:hypothetical protein
MAFKFRQGLEANRTSVTPASGEPLFTIDSHMLYVGDGTTAGGNLIGGSTVAVRNGKPSGDTGSFTKTMMARSIMQTAPK